MTHVIFLGEVLMHTTKSFQVVRGTRLARWVTSALTGILASLFFLFLGVPLISLLLRQSPSAIWAEMLQPDILQALQLSVLTTTFSTLLAVILGLPAAYLLARKHFPGRKILETLITMPTVLPPVVAGVALLLTFGR